MSCGSTAGARTSGPAALLADLEALFPASPRCRTRCQPGRPSRTTSFEVELDAPSPRLAAHPARRHAALDRQAADELLAYLEWGINRTAAEWLGQTHLLFHAGSVACRERGLILPAASGSGKTTLVAGLVAAGCRYLSDEVAVIEPANSTLLPFAKSLCVKAGRP